MSSLQIAGTGSARELEQELDEALEVPLLVVVHREVAAVRAVQVAALRQLSAPSSPCAPDPSCRDWRR